MDQLFDEAARILAKGVSRREAVALLFGALIAAAFPTTAAAQSCNNEGQCAEPLTCVNCIGGNGSNRQCLTATQACCGSGLNDNLICNKGQCCCLNSTNGCAASSGGSCPEGCVLV